MPDIASNPAGPPGGAPDPAIDRSGLTALALVAQYLGVGADPDALAHRLGLAASPAPEDLLRAARELGLKARHVRTKPRRLGRMSLPALAAMRTGGFVVLAKATDREVLVHDPATGATAPQPLAEFARAWTGHLIVLAKRAAAPDAERRFDIGWFVAVARKYKHLFGEVLLASLFLQLFGLVSPLLFQVVIDKVLVHHGITTLDVLVIAMALLACFEVLLGHLRSYLFSHTTNRIDVELGSRMFAHLLALPMSYFEARRVGDSVARVRELDGVRSFITGSALTLVVDSLFTVVFLAVMASYSLMLTAIVVATIPIYLLISLVVTPILKRRLDEKAARSMENQAFLVELIGGVETLKAMAVEPRVRRRWEEQLAGYTAAAFHASEFAGAAGHAVNLVSKVSTVALLWIGAHGVITGELTVGQLIAFNMLAARVAAPILRLSQLWQDFQQMRVSITRLGDIMNNPAETPSLEAHSNPPTIEGRITLDQVSFRYRQDGPPVLDGVSLDIAPGEVIGIVGPSGSGKSTLARLIQRLQVPERGRVLVDGIDLALVDPSWLRRQMGIVLQDSVLFNRTVRENIALADPTMSMSRVIEAAKLAGAHDFILELPKAYDSVIGERGCTLSGGQRQRIAIARALLNDPRILILDEATSMLDVESERVIQSNLRKIAAGRTVIVIAHRLSTVRRADRIITLERGRLVEDGPPDELLRRGGRFADLHLLQTGLQGAD
jgi:subfamily B ATP-binding cassette protein HlyB/CyaB